MNRKEGKRKHATRKRLPIEAELLVDAAQTFRGQKPARAVGALADFQQGRMFGNRIKRIARFAEPAFDARITEGVRLGERDGHRGATAASSALAAREPLI